MKNLIIQQGLHEAPHGKEKHEKITGNDKEVMDEKAANAIYFNLDDKAIHEKWMDNITDLK